MPVPRFKTEQCVWNEEIHTFSPVGNGRYRHYVRLFGTTSADDKPATPSIMTYVDVSNWIANHTLPPLTTDDVNHAKSDMDEKGNFGPMDNPKKGEKSE